MSIYLYNVTRFKGEKRMKIKSLLSLITLGVGVGALGLTSVVSSNAKNVPNLKAEKEATAETGPKVGDTEGWFLGNGINGWSVGNPFTFDETGVYSTTITLTDTKDAERNAFKFHHKDPDIWIDFSAIQNFRNIDPSIIKLNNGGNSSITETGTYKFSYVHSNYSIDNGKYENKTAFWIEKVGAEVTGEVIYLGTDLQIGKGENAPRVAGNYLYAWNDDGTGTQKYEQLGSWPGTPIEKLNRTDYFGTSSCLNFAGNGGIYKIDTSLFPKANRFILSYENGATKVQTKDMHLEVTGCKRYYSFFQAPATSDGNIVDGDETVYNAAELAFDLSKALEGTTLIAPGGENNSYYSVCNLTDKAQLKGLIDKYDALGKDKVTFDKSTYLTYVSGEGETSTNDDIALAQLMNQIKINYAKTTNSVMFLGGNSSNNATLVVAGISVATIIASASMIILRRHKHKKA